MPEWRYQQSGSSFSRHHAKHAPAFLDSGSGHDRDDGRKPFRHPGMTVTMDGNRFDIRPLLDPAANRLGYEVRYHYAEKSEDYESVINLKTAKALGLKVPQAV